jgi:23S rRNA pseudouridine1911/1915/1917 synthase
MAGLRLDRAVAFLTGMPRAAAASLVTGGRVLVDGVPERRRSIAVRAGSHLVVPTSPAAAAALAPEPDVAFSVVFADDDVIVVDKPWDLVVHPGAGRMTGTLVGGILARYPEVAALVPPGRGGQLRPGIVHRLDRGTSGLLVVARSPRALGSLRGQMAAHRARRRYVVLVHGHLEHDRGLIDAPVTRSSRRPTTMTVSPAGREARSFYEVLQRIEVPQWTLATVDLETGRTHQVRVHMAAIGHPVVGDRIYAKGRPTPLPAGRHFLHAFELGFEHPADGSDVVFSIPLAPDLAELFGEEPTIG